MDIMCITQEMRRRIMTTGKEKNTTFSVLPDWLRDAKLQGNVIVIPEFHIKIPESPTIVVCWSPKEAPFWSCFATTEIKVDWKFRVLGSGFIPEQEVVLTICAKNQEFARTKTNPCGAFEVYAVLPGVPSGVVSIKAWVNNELKASWPVNIVKEIQKPPK
jgi:hypothetical protein